MHACTIIAKNYLAQARVLARSFHEHNPESHFAVLVIDELGDLIDPRSEPFTLLTPRDIACDPFTRMATRYDVLELSTAVKPWLLRQQLAAGAPAITYLDPDIRVFASLEALDQRARAHGLALTPHNTVPIPDDGKRPTQIDIMIAGVYNLGYVSVGQGTEIDALIEWWTGRLRRDCRVDPVYGYFVDQRWFDLAPGFVSDFTVIREPEYNVAYWNVHSRELSHEEDGYRIDGRPLAFFHFSGFDPSRPEVLSRHQTRIDLALHPQLRRICAEYAAAVNGEGYALTSTWKYSYGRLPNGSRLTRPLRTLYAQGEDDGALTKPPFDADGCEQFMVWAGGQQPGAPAGVSRALAAAYGSRPDLRAAFPDLDGAGLAPFLSWAHEHIDDEELGFPERLLGSPSTSSDPAPGQGQELVSATTPEPPWGVNVVGYFRSELGVGEAARQVVTALDAADVPLLPLHGAMIPLSRQGHAFHHLDSIDASYPVNLICMNADALPEFAEQAGRPFFEDRYSIGLWFWEVTTPPSGGWTRSFQWLDEVWVPTAHVAAAVTPVSPLPVVKVKIPIELPPVSPLARDTVSLPGDFLFLFSFDYLSVFARKNPLAVIEAFKRAFEPGAGAALALKCINHARDESNHARLLMAAAEHPDIYVLDGYFSAWQKNGLTASCDCYVSLHRSEGFGLTMAEAMFLGKPVIATGYSGNLDFMNAQNSYLVDYELVTIGSGAHPYPPSGEWAEPDVEHASRLMGSVFADRSESSARGKLGARQIRETHSAAAAGAVMAHRLGSLRELHPGSITRFVAPDLRPWIEQGPVAPPRSAAGAVGPLVRRLALRMMKPFTAYQRTVNEQTVRSLEALEQSTILLGQAQQRAESAALAHARRADLAQVAMRHEINELQALQAPLAARMDELTSHLGIIDSERRAVPYMDGPPFEHWHHPNAGNVQGYRHDPNAAGADTYRSFEDVFRGAEGFIRDRQRKFVAIIGDREPVLDFGCGRGEFLDLMRERGLSYVGVDSDLGMVNRCRQKGHERVVLADGLDYLESLEPRSLGAIFCAQVIEHLPYMQLLRFLTESVRVLAGDGMLIAETVNPHSPPALKTFWVDLTHQHPIFPEVALALCQLAGFAEAMVFHPNGRGDVDADRYVAGEYAVVARVAAEPPPSAR